MGDRRRIDHGPQFSTARGCEYLAWRAIVRRELGRDTAIAYNSVGAPVLINRSLYISVSHCRERIAVALSDMPCASTSSAPTAISHVHFRAISPLKNNAHPPIRDFRQLLGAPKKFFTNMQDGANSTCCATCISTGFDGRRVFQPFPPSFPPTRLQCLPRRGWTAFLRILPGAQFTPMTRRVPLGRCISISMRDSSSCFYSIKNPFAAHWHDFQL